MKFTISKNGYNTAEVDRFILKTQLSNQNQLSAQKDRIFALQEENKELRAKLERLSSKESSINSALLVAVDKAKQIEEDSKKVYELEIKRLRLLFAKYSNLLDKLIESNPESEQTKSTKAIVEEFRRSIDGTIENNFSKPVTPQSAYDPMQTLLSKLNNFISNKKHDLNIQPKREIDIAQTIADPIKIKPIAEVKMDASDNFENLVDKFLEVGDGEEKNAFAKKLMHSNGFDLREAVNPTEDLEEIMKSFDFYEDDE